MDDYAVPGLATPCVYYDPDFLPPDEADELYDALRSETKWEKTAKINRWVALYEDTADDDDDDEGGGENEGAGGDAPRDYKYRDAPGGAVTGFTDAIRRIKEKAEAWHAEKSSPADGETTTTTKPVKFNVCLLNFYEDGSQRIGWHSDREEIGRSTPIASVSLGATRQFLIRAKEDGARDRASLDMTSGSLVVMENVCQHKYVHTVPKQSEVTGGRINLTFRCKGAEEGTAGEAEHERRDNWLVDLAAAVGASGAALKAGGFSAAADANGPAATAVFGDGIEFDAVQPDDNLCFAVSTNIGSEAYCAAEIKELLGENVSAWDVVARPFGIGGYVGCSLLVAAKERNDDDEAELLRAAAASALLQLRSAHNVLEYDDHFALSEVVVADAGAAVTGDGDEAAAASKEKDKDKVTAVAMYEFYKKRLVDGTARIGAIERMKKSAAVKGDDGGDEIGTFRATCERTGGPHAFQAPDIEWEVGGAISEYYSDCCKPQMTNYDVNVRIDIVNDRVIVGTQLNVDDLSKGRHFLRFRNAVTIKTNLAYVMVRLANVQDGALVADPFCGSGTILLEAMEMHHKRIKCVGMDVSRRSANGARENAEAEGCGPDVCDFHCADARALRKHLADGSVDAIVTNLPWGVMTGNKNVSDLQEMYEVFLRIAWYALKDGGRIVMLVLRGLQLTRIVQKLGGRYRLVHVNVIRTTNNLPCIVVVEKLARDEVNESVKGQLAYLSQFVNISKDMYHAIHYEQLDKKQPGGAGTRSTTADQQSIDGS